MTEHILHQVDLARLTVDVGGKRMAQGVWGDVLVELCFDDTELPAVVADAPLG